MKNNLITLLILLFTQQATGQETVLGFYELQIGEKYDKVKTLFETQMVMGYMLETEFKTYNEWNPGSVKETDYAKDFYRVKKSQKKYFTYLGVEVKTVEVRFDENQSIAEIFLVITKNPANEKQLMNEAQKKWGNTDCAFGYSENTYEIATFYCMWFSEGCSLTLSNFNGMGEIMYDKDIMVNIKKE